MPVKTLGIALAWIGRTMLNSGRRERAEEFYNEAKQLAERSGQGNLVLISMMIDGIFAMLDGRFEEVESINRQITERGEELGLAEYARLCAGWSRQRCELLLGKAAEFPEYYPETNIHRVLYLVHIGHDNEAKEILKHSVLERPGLGSARGLGCAAHIAFVSGVALPRSRRGHRRRQSGSRSRGGWRNSGMGQGARGCTCGCVGRGRRGWFLDRNYRGLGRSR